MRLELTRRLVNPLQAWDDTDVRLNTLESISIVQIITQFVLRVANINNGLMNN